MAASGGQQALAMLTAWHPTLVLLDMRMPFMHRWAVCWASENEAGHLAKPFGLDELISCVEEHMGRERPN